MNLLKCYNFIVFRIIAVNYIARSKGVTRHMRGDEAKKMCPEIQLPSVPCVRGKADISKCTNYQLPLSHSLNFPLKSINFQVQRCWKGRCPCFARIYTFVRKSFNWWSIFRYHSSCMYLIKNIRRILLIHILYYVIIIGWIQNWLL